MYVKLSKVKYNNFIICKNGQLHNFNWCVFWECFQDRSLEYKISNQKTKPWCKSYFAFEYHLVLFLILFSDHWDFHQEIWIHNSHLLHNRLYSRIFILSDVLRRILKAKMKCLCAILCIFKKKDIFAVTCHRLLKNLLHKANFWEHSCTSKRLYKIRKWVVETFSYN